MGETQQVEVKQAVMEKRLRSKPKKQLGDRSSDGHGKGGHEGKQEKGKKKKEEGERRHKEGREEGGPRSHLLSSRGRRRELAHETLRIIETMQYTAVDGPKQREHDISANLNAAVQGTRVYLDEAKFPEKPTHHPNHTRGCPPIRAQKKEPHARPTKIEVTDETTVLALKRLRRAHPHVRIGVLNFASARNPGGGFQKGSLAQEESLALASGLFACQTSDLCRPYYSFHNKHRDTRYSHTMLYSPQVPFFRRDDGELCAPYCADVLTSAAVNAGVCLKRGVPKSEISALMSERISRLLRIFASQGNDVLVLGAFGCGVFCNHPQLVAKLFRHHLTRNFASAFKHITFAIPGRDKGVNGMAFARVFADDYVSSSSSENDAEQSDKEEEGQEERDDDDNGDGGEEAGEEAPQEQQQRQ